MRAVDVAALVRQLELSGIDIWLDGGWGVDALLGKQTRPHEDLDLVVPLDDVPLMRALLVEEGFELVDGEAGSTFVLGDARARKIDVHTVRFDADGNGVYRMLNGEDWVYPAEGFAGTGTVGSHPVRCLTAEAQVLCHATGYEPDETDLQDMAALRERFGVDLPPQLMR